MSPAPITVSAVLTPSETRTCDRVAAACSVAALVVAMLLSVFHRVGTYQVETDFYWAYGPQAENLLAGRPYGYTFHPPGYPLLVAAVSLLTGDLFAAAKILSAFATGAFVWFTYLLVKALFDARLALATALLTFAAVVPFSFQAATDVVGALFMLLPLWALLRRPFPTSWSCVAAGMLAGAAYLVRTNAIAVIAGVVISLLLGINASRPLRRRLADCSIFLFGVLLTTAPWLAVNWARHGQPFASTNYLQVAAHFYLPGGEVNSITSLRQAGQLFRSPWEVLTYQPLRLLRRLGKDTLYSYPRSLILFVLQVPAAIVACVGLISLVRHRSRRLLAWFLTSALGYLLLGLANFQVRFYFFLFPLLFLLVAAGLFRLALAATRLARSRAATKLGWALVAVLLVVYGVRSAEQAHRVFREEPRHLLRIADVLRGRSWPGDGMIVRKPHLAFLAGLTLTPFPLATSAEEFLASAKDENVRYIAYSDREAEMWPGLKALGEPTSLPGDFRLVVRDEPTDTLVYEIASVVERGAPSTRDRHHRAEPIPRRIWLALLLAGVLLGSPLVTEYAGRRRQPANGGS